VAYRPGDPIATLQLVVRAGEADSPAALPGLAAMTSRLIGKGSKLVSAGAVENMIEAMGAEYTAEALMDYTVFTLRVLEERLDRAIYVLRLMALDSSFSERDLIAERRDSYWDLYNRKKDPEFLGWRQFLRALFENHPYRIATYAEDVIMRISAKDVSAFYSRFYRPNNAFVLISGNINGAAAGRKVGAQFNAWARQDVERPFPAPPPRNTGDRFCYVEDPEARDATVFIGNVVMGSSDPEFFPFLVLKHILGGTTLSRLSLNLRESNSYARYVFCETEFFRSCGVFWARARLVPEFILPGVREIVREVRALSVEPPGPSEIEEAKAFLIGNMPARFEAPEGFSDMMARFVALDLDDGQWDKGPERIKLVDAERARLVAQKYLADKLLVVIVGRPEWLERHLAEVGAVEVYDNAGKLKRTVGQGVER
jgi:zinc protease